MPYGVGPGPEITLVGVGGVMGPDEEGAVDTECDSIGTAATDGGGDWYEFLYAKRTCLILVGIFVEW